MTNDEFDHIDTPDIPEEPGAAKPSIKEVWEGNPMLKIAAVLLAGAVAFGGYKIFLSGDDSKEKQSIMKIGSDATVKQAPGQQVVDPVYRKAVEEVNKKTAERAEKTGGSAMPTPINTASSGSLNIPEAPDKPKADVLAEWRKATETSKIAVTKAAVEMQSSDASPSAPPDVVPMVQPLRPQQGFKQDPKAAQALAGQMRVIIAAQAPAKSSTIGVTKADSAYDIQKAAEAAQKAAANAPAAGSEESGNAAGVGKDGKAEPAKVIEPAGSIAYAQLLTELNSDVKGPVLAQILSGPFSGARALGKVEVKDEYMVITFSRIIKDTVSYGVNGIALDEATTLAGQATDVDHHYFVRVILPAAAKFVEGYGSAISTTGTTTTQTSGGGQATDTPKPDAKESLYKGVEESSSKISDILDKGAERPITVKIAKGTTMGVLFLDPVTTKDAGK